MMLWVCPKCGHEWAGSGSRCEQCGAHGDPDYE